MLRELRLAAVRKHGMAVKRLMSWGLWSIRGRFYLAFLAFSILMAGFGIYAIESIRDTSALVTRTYDKPLMAINFARSAQFEFASMDHELARVSLTSDPEQRQRHLHRIQ